MSFRQCSAKRFGRSILGALRRKCAAATLCVLGWVLLAGASPSSDFLQLGSEVRVVLEPGVSVRLLVRAEADRELRLVASQETVDVSLEVELSDGSASARRFDHPGGRYGRELVLLPATTSLRAVVVRATQRGATTLSLEALTEEPAAAEADWTLGAELWARVLRGGAEAGLRRRTSDAFVRAAAAAGERGDRSLEAVARLAAGTAAMAVAAVDARTQLEAAEGLFASLGDARGRAAANAELGVLAWRTGRLDDADAHHRRALDARRRAGDALGEAESRNNLALVAQMRGRHASAKDGYGRALELARQADARELAAAVVQNLGSLHHERGRLRQAVEAYRRSIALRREMGLDQRTATTLSNLAVAHRALGELGEALAAFEEALRLHERSGDPRGRGAALSGLGRLHLLLGEPQVARDLLRESTRFRRQAGDWRGQAASLHNLATAERRLGHLDRAQASLHHAIAVREGLDDRRGLAASLHELARLERDRARHAAALEAVQRALDLRESLDPSAAAISRRLRAELWLDMEREPIERIVAELRSALAVQDAAGAGAAAATTRVTLARAETTRGRLQTARAALERAVDEFERQRAKVPDPVRRATFLAEHRRAAEDLIGTLWRLHRRAPDAGHAVQAFAVAERAKARSLLDRLASLDETPPGDDSPASTERRALLDRLAELSFRERRHGEDVARAVDDARSRLRVLDAERLEQRFGVAVSEPPAEADEVRAWLDPQTAGLGVFWGERSAYAWVLTDDDLTMFELPAPDRLAGRTAAARLAWSRLTVGGEESGDVHQAAENLAAKGVAAADDVQMDRAAEAPVATDPAAELAAALLQPARAQLADRERWIVAADGPLAALPFAALPLPWRGGKSTSDPVVLRHEVVQLPSLSVIRALRRRAADAGHGGGEIVVVADPPATSALPASRLEAQAVAEAVRAAGSVVPTRLVVGTDASRQRVLDGLFESADVVHLAVHGVVDPDQPERTALRLAQRDAVGRPIDGDLRLADIHRLRLRADLVVLSGCRTALGREIRGEGHLGLSHAFLAAGAERVVASLWPVADAATAELMRRFYRELLGGGVAPSTALRRAQVSLRAETRWRHPVYWAGFVVSGDWRS